MTPATGSAATTTSRRAPEARATRASAMGSRPHSDARARSRPWQRTRQRGADLPVIFSISPLIERDRELSLFEDILGADAGAGSQAVVIEGPAGIGKSRLIAELRDRAAEHGSRGGPSVQCLPKAEHPLSPATGGGAVGLRGEHRPVGAAQ